MKRYVALLLTAVMLLCSVGCSLEKVPNTASYPDYTFNSTPTTDELRATAVQAMRDILSIQWHTEESYNYYKSGPVRTKEFKYEPGNIYAGILYTNANSGLFQFLEFYNYKTGALEYNDSVNKLKTDLGISCADAVLWAWSTVCNSVIGPFYPNKMVQQCGYLPVGEYTYDPTLATFNYYPTLRIIKDNGPEVMTRSYAQLLPADALVSSTDDHAMMVIDLPHIEYLADGQIDTANSYVLIQDQRAGGDSLQVKDEKGNVLHYSGRLEAKFTFEELLNKNFIPVTAAEFVGQKEYEKATVSVAGDVPETLESVLAATVESNYPLAVVNLIVNDQVIDRELFSGTPMNGVPRSFSINNLDAAKVFTNSEHNKPGAVIKIEVVVSTGERFVPIEYKI